MNRAKQKKATERKEKNQVAVGWCVRVDSHDGFKGKQVISYACALGEKRRTRAQGRRRGTTTYPQVGMSGLAVMKDSSFKVMYATLTGRRGAPTHL